MRRNRLTFCAFLLSPLLIASCSLLPNIDKSSKVHVHSANSDSPWFYDDNFHWKECAANDYAMVEVAPHSFIESETALGFKETVCDVCGYMKTVSSNATTITVNHVDIEKNSSNEVVLSINCNAASESLSVRETRVAFGLAYYEPKDGSSNITLINDSSFVVGSFEPSISEFTLIQNITNISSDELSCEFSYEYVLSGKSFYDGTRSNKGIYAVFFGTQETYGKIRSDGNGGLIDAIRESDETYRYNFRDDNGGTNRYVALVIEEKPSFAFEEVSLFQDEYNQIWARIGGRKKSGVTLETLQSINPFIRFQSMTTYAFYPINANYDPNDAVVDNPLNVDMWYFEVKENKAYINIYVDFMKSGTKYNTHLNVTDFVSQDCVLDIEGTLEQEFRFNNDSRVFTAYFNPTGPHTPANIYGNFGFAVS